MTNPRVNIVYTCFQCRYSDDVSETFKWCYEACRQLEDLDEIPKWCPLEKA